MCKQIRATIKVLNFVYSPILVVILRPQVMLFRLNIPDTICYNNIVLIMSENMRDF